MKALIIGLAVLAATGQARAAVAPGDLIVTAGAARYSLSSGHSALAMLDETSRGLFVRNLRLDDPAMAALWGRVLTGAVQIRHESGDAADTLWFNPLFDGGVAAHWTRVDGLWRAQAVEPVTGGALRGEAGPVTPHGLAWLNGGGDMGKALAGAAQATFAAADKADWAAFYTTPGNDLAAVMRAYEGNAGLYRMIETPGYAAALPLLDHLMISDDPAADKLPAALQKDLAVYGDTARRTLSPVAAYRRKDGWTVAMQSPDAPQVVWLIHFADPKGGDPAMPRGFEAVGTGPAQKETAQ